MSDEARKESQENPFESKEAELSDQDPAHVAGETGMPEVGKVLQADHERRAWRRSTAGWGTTSVVAWR